MESRLLFFRTVFLVVAPASKAERGATACAWWRTVPDPAFTELELRTSAFDTIAPPVQGPNCKLVGLRKRGFRFLVESPKLFACHPGLILFGKTESTRKIYNVPVGKCTQNKFHRNVGDAFQHRIALCVMVAAVRLWRSEGDAPRGAGLGAWMHECATGRRGGYTSLIDPQTYS